jgi:hypothetical protein
VLTAAAILLGLLATIGVAMLQHDDASRTSDASNGDNWSFAIPGGQPMAIEQLARENGERLRPQDPKPKPKPKPVQDPQEPKPKPGSSERPKPTPDPNPNQDPKPTGRPLPTDRRKPAKEGNDPAGEFPKSPKGTDPADLAAIRSAEAMLEAERKLAKSLAEGKIKGFDKLLRFDELTGWEYKSGLEGMPESVKGLAGKKVLMTGFMLPIDEVQNIKEFLLVQSLWACCYGKPPDIHGIVRCVMPKEKTTDYSFEPLQVIGTFTVEATMMEGFCVDIYQLHVESLEPIK